MEITVTRVIRELKEKYGYENIKGQNQLFAEGIVKDTLTIIDNQLKRDKGISIK